MSASREKKIRQDLAAQGVTDPKKIREAEEKAKARKNNILYGVIAGVFVIVAAVLLVYNSGVLQRSATAATINGEKYTAGQVEYFYANVKSSLLKSSYASFYGIDTSKSLDQQVVSDTMKTALGIEDEGDVTWEQYVRDTAVKQLAMYVLTAQEAEANGMGADEHTQEELDATMEELNRQAERLLHEDVSEADLRQEHDRGYLQGDGAAGGRGHPLPEPLRRGADLHRQRPGDLLSGQQEQL